MKTLHLVIIAVFLITSTVFLIIPQHAYANTCAVKETIYSAPEFFLLSDNVFVGNVTSITDYGNHQWQVHFNIEKIWKGTATRQTSTVMTNTLQACGYSITVGGKYLIYTNGSPSTINTIFSKMYSDAQNDIALFDDPKFQSEEKSKEDLNKKLDAAQGTVESMMMDKSSHIPINGVGVDEVNSTLDIVIDDERATLSVEQYTQNLKNILGDLPMKVEFGHATTALPILHNTNDSGLTTSNPIIRGLNSSNVLESPLRQFKSGIVSNDVKCAQDLQLVIKIKDGSPACTRPQTAQKLVERKWGWVMQPIDLIKSLPNRIQGLENNSGMVTFGNQAYYFVTPTYTDTAYSIPVQVSFHDVVFTLFPPGFRGGLPSGGCGNDDTVGKIVTGGGSYYWADAKFSDGVHELLHMFADSQPCPIYPKQTMLSNHTNPQAGLTFYAGRMKLLVSVGNTVSSSANYTIGSKVTGDVTYLSQTVDEWKSKTPEQLRAYYEKYKDAFYDELGSFLIKDEMKKELARQNIQNAHDDFKVFPGMSLDSLPPHISYDAVVNATDGNSYLLLGGVFANKIESSPKIIKLVFDKNALHSLSTGNGPSYPDPSTDAHVNNSTSQERVQIAGTYIENSDIPWSSVGTGNYGVIQIGLYTSVYHMIPDAQKYYTARAMQLIPFYVPVTILPPPSTAK